MSAIDYTLHCTDDSLPFIAMWYGGTIALCALAGAVLSPRLLRWRGTEKFCRWHALGESCYWVQVRSLRTCQVTRHG